MNETNNQSNHIIEQVRFELGYYEQGSAYQVQTELFSLFHAQLERLASAVLDEVEQEIGPLRLERLYLDIGDLEPENWQEELVRKFPIALADALHQHQREVVRQGKNDDAENKVTSRLELFMYYLAFGSLPWWASKKQIDLKSLLHDLLSEQGSELVKALKGQEHHPEVAQRFAVLVSNQDFYRVIRVLQPSDASFILEFVETVVRIQAHRPLAHRSQSDFFRSVQQLVIIDLLLNHGTGFNRKMFVKRQVVAMAKAFGKSFAEMLALLSEGVKGVQIPFSLRNALPAVIAEIQEEEAPTDLESPVQATSTIEIFDAFLQNKVPEVFTKKRFIGLMASEPKEVIKVLKKHRPEDYIRTRLLTPFGLEISATLVELLAPEQQGFIEEYTEELFFIHKKRTQFNFSASSYEMLVWEIILIDLIKEYGSSFNRRSFIQRTLIKMAEGLGVVFQVFLTSFLSAIDQVKIPAGFDDSIIGIIQSISRKYSQVVVDEKQNSADLDWMKQVLEAKKRVVRMRFDSVWEREILDRPQALLQLVVTIGTTPKGRKTLLNTLVESQLVDLVELMEPENATTLLGNKAALDRWQVREKIVQTSQSDFSKAQWWIILNYLLNNRGTRFNQKSFLKNLVTQVAIRFRSVYSVLIRQLGHQSLRNQGGGAFESGFTSLIQELRDEDERLETSRELVFEVKAPLSSEDEFAFLLLYLDKGYLPWDLLLNHPDFSAEKVAGRLVDQKERFWVQLLEKTSAVEEVLLLRLVTLVGVETGAPMIEGLMKHKHGALPGKPFLESLEQMAPDQERFQKVYYTKVMLHMLRGEAIDFEVLSENLSDEKSKTSIANDFQNKKEQLSSVFLQQLHSHSLNTDPSLPTTLEGLLHYPSQLRKLISQLSVDQLKRLVSALDEAVLYKLTRALFHQKTAMFELIKTFEGLARADARLIAQVTLKRHWMAIFIQTPWSVQKQGGHQWMAEWWRSLIGLTRLPADQETKMRASMIKKLSKPLSKLFSKTIKEQQKGKVQSSEETMFLENDVLALVKNTKALQKIAVTRWDQLEGQWRIFMQRAPKKAFQVLEEIKHNTGVFDHWVKHFNEFTLEITWRLISPQYGQRALALAGEVQALLIQSQLVRFSAHESQRVLWNWLLNYWNSGNLDDFNEGSFIKAFLSHMSQYAKTSVDLETSFTNFLRSSNLNYSKKSRLLKLVDTDKTNKARNSSPANEPLAEEPLEKEKQQDQSALYVGNAGLVLLWPYFQRLFGKMELVKDGKFISEELQEKAIWVTQFLVNGRTNDPEYELPLNKLLCGWPLAKPLINNIELSDEEQEVCISLVQASVANWKTLGSTSIEGFRESFIQRDGKLGKADARWELTVETKSFDVLLDTIPWGFKTVRLPWMDDLLEVDWR